MNDLLSIENQLFSAFENYYFKGEKWVLQKRISWKKRGIPVSDLSFFDYEYKIRKQSQINNLELFDYYLIIFNNFEEFEIDYENLPNAGWQNGEYNIYEGSLTKRLKFFNLGFFEDLNSTQQFIDWILDNYKPSSFSFT